MADHSDSVSKLDNPRAIEDSPIRKSIKRMRTGVSEQQFETAVKQLMEGDSTMDLADHATIPGGNTLPEGQRKDMLQSTDAPQRQKVSVSDDVEMEDSNVANKSDTRASEFLIKKAAAVNNFKVTDDLLTTHDDNSNDENTGDSRARDISVSGVIVEDREVYSVCNGYLKKCTQQQARPVITRYDSSFPGKAKITIKLPPDQTTARKGKNLIKIWMALTNSRICPSSVDMLNHFTAEAEFSDYLEANLALEAIEKIPSKLKAFVEQRSMINRGVVADWPSSIRDLWSAIQNKAGIIGMERMYRRKWDNSTKKTTLAETDNIIVTFKGVGIRDLQIFTNNVGLKVRPFVPQTRQCFNCYRFGHTKISCKSETYCIACGEKSHGQCEKPVKCRNCGGSHKSTFRKCPVFEKNVQINIVMAHRNIPFFSARRIVEGSDRHMAPPSEISRDVGTWPRLPPSKAASFAEVTRNQDNAGRSKQRVETPPVRRAEHVGRPAGLARGRVRETSENSNQEYYKRFDLRSEEINRNRQGIMLSAARNGASWSSCYTPRTTGEGPSTDRLSQVPQDFINGMREMWPLLLQLSSNADFRALMDRIGVGGKPMQSESIDVREAYETADQSEYSENERLRPPHLT